MCGGDGGGGGSETIYTWWWCHVSVYKDDTFKFFFQFEISFQVDDMSWTCSLCQNTYSRKDSMQRDEF